MKFISIFAFLLLLSACQQPDSEVQETNTTKETTTLAETPASTKTDVRKEKLETSKSQGDFSLLVDLPYEIVESDEKCESPVVIEFFAYQCPHCYTLEKFAEQWRSEHEREIEFLSVPTHLGHQEFGAFLILHQSAKKLGLLDKVRPLLFKRIHDEKKSFASPEEAIAFLVSAGANAVEAKKAIEDEEAIKTGIDENFRLIGKYKIAAVPTILVNHRYKFDVTKAGGYEKVFQVVEQTLLLPSECGTN